MNDMLMVDEKCNYCKNNKCPENKEKIGKTVCHKTYIGRGHDQTTFQYFQCMECGSIWQITTDSGAGGHGTYYAKIS